MTDPSAGGAADGAVRRAGLELTSLTTLVFDVLGTLLDEDGALAAAAAAACADTSDADPAEFVRGWAERETSLMAAVRDGRAAYETIDVLRGRALAATLTAFGITLAGADLDRLARAGHRLTPFPDTVVAFGRLAQERAMVALTNANQAMAFDMSRYAGLCWHTLLSAETVRTYKPDPRMYAYAIERLELDPGEPSSWPRIRGTWMLRRPMGSGRRTSTEPGARRRSWLATPTGSMSSYRTSPVSPSPSSVRPDRVRRDPFGSAAQAGSAAASRSASGAPPPGCARATMNVMPSAMAIPYKTHWVATA